MKYIQFVLLILFTLIGCNTNNDSNKSKDFTNDSYIRPTEKTGKLKNQLRNESNNKDKVEAPEFYLEPLDIGITDDLHELAKKNVKYLEFFMDQQIERYAKKPDIAFKRISDINKSDIVMEYAIFYKDKIAGIIGIESLGDYDENSADIYYWLGKEFWGKGLVTHAVKQIFDLIFLNNSNLYLKENFRDLTRLNIAMHWTRNKKSEQNVNSEKVCKRLNCIEMKKVNGKYKYKEWPYYNKETNEGPIEEDAKVYSMTQKRWLKVKDKVGPLSKKAA